MARVTVEDCLLKVPNKFELVLLAAKRAKDVEAGATPAVPKDNDKPAIIALREIADDVISIDGLRKISKKSIVEDTNTIHTFGERTDIEEEEIVDDREPVKDFDEEETNDNDELENADEK
ncbi:MAG: DNA-directed RNA polymerase subunit omega [Holosporales bacterium]|jgi:DNA-directed RNA polymerase omega subunit|nr:DNA-directed RNA polymerase subunit omega [Holosporales bacterium]